MDAWAGFYTIVGTAAASLVGLTFVALSISASFITEERRAGSRIFVSPTIVHFTGILVVSLIALMPGASAAQRDLFLGVGLIGMGHAGWVLHRIVVFDRAEYSRDGEDVLLYGVGPLLWYLVIVIGSALLVDGHTDGAYVLAVGVVLLLLLEIRNAWDLTLWAIIRSKQE